MTATGTAGAAGRGLGRDRPAPTEAQFQESVLELAHLLGWRVAHFRVGRTANGGWRTPVAADGAGFFDLVLVRDRVIFAELKSETGHLTKPQQEWLVTLRAAGADARVWRPSDWKSIVEVLQR